MNAAEHIPSKSKILSDRISGFVIPWKRVALYVSLAVGFFLLGFLPMWSKASEAMEQRDAAQREVRLSQLQNTLGLALADVHRGEYEPARQSVSEFYTRLRSQIDAGKRSVFTQTQRDELRPLLAERDDLITLLARSDPACADRVVAVYSAYLKVTSNRGQLG